MTAHARAMAAVASLGVPLTAAAHASLFDVVRTVMARERWRVLVALEGRQEAFAFLRETMTAAPAIDAPARASAHGLLPGCKGDRHSPACDALTDLFRRAVRDERAAVGEELARAGLSEDAAFVASPAANPGWRKPRGDGMRHDELLKLVHGLNVFGFDGGLISRFLGLSDERTWHRMLKKEDDPARVALRPPDAARLRDLLSEAKKLGRGRLDRDQAVHLLVTLDLRNLAPCPSAGSPGTS